MIYVDANVFLRALTRSPEPRVQRMNDIAGNLLRAAERGEVELTTSDAVIAEVDFILTAKAHYHLPVSDAAARLATLVRFKGSISPTRSRSWRRKSYGPNAPNSDSSTRWSLVNPSIKGRNSRPSMPR